jgi:HPt (histidine-containing phosphotransfer) domain-containing protein
MCDVLRQALHRVVDACIVAEDALREHGSGERLDEAVAALTRTLERVVVAHAALHSAAP